MQEHSFLNKLMKENLCFKNLKDDFSKYKLSKSILIKQTKHNDYNYTYINTTYLIFNEKCRIVARFKDYLIYDDSTEFLRRFYNNNELNPRLSKIYNFYETYSKIFPNYMILPESFYLYRNIRKKQKMIDAFNEIKREEEENRKNLQLGKKNQNSNKKINNIIIFDKSIQDSINRYQQSMINNFDDSKSTISISLYNKPFNNPNSAYVTPTESFRDDNNDTTIASIQSIVLNLNKNFDIFQNNLLETPKRGNSTNKNNHIEQQNALNNNKKFISHKAAVSVPEVKKLDNNCKNKNNMKEKLIQGKSTEKNKKRNLELKFDFQNHLNKSPKNERLNTISTSTIEKSKKPLKKEEKNYFKRETKAKNSEFKSPNSKNINQSANKISLLPKRPITTTIKTTNHIMPIYKNKMKDKNLNNNDNYSASLNKVNPLKTKLEKKKCNTIKKHNTMKSLGNILDKKTFLSSFTSNNTKDLKNIIIHEYNKDSFNQNINHSKGLNVNMNNLNTNEKKNFYKNYIEKNKINRNSYDPSNKNKMIKNFENNNLSINSNGVSHRKIHNLKSPSIDKKNVFSPHLMKVPLSAMQHKIKVERTPFNHKESHLKEKDNNIIKQINFKHVDMNTKKMKFVKK